MADEATPVAEPTVEQQLTELFEGDKKPTPADVEPKGEDSSPPPSDPPAEKKENEPEVKAEPTLEEKLAAIEDEKPEDPKTPQLTAEQSTILSAIPDQQTLANVAANLETFGKFNDAFSSHNFAAVEEMLKTGNPTGFEAFLDYIYETRVSANAEKGWLSRWIAEQEGGKGVTSAQRALEARLNQLQGQLTAKEQREQAAQQQRATEARKAEFVGHLDKLFDQINFSKGDRKYVVSDIFDRIRSTPATRSAINGGNFKAVNAIFKAAVTEYSQRDKDAKAAIDVKLKAQETKKVIAGTGGGASELTDSASMETAKPEERENVMLRQLQKLWK